MRLIVSGFTPETVQYQFLWGRYVTGFEPSVHCQPCLLGSPETKIRPDMMNQEIELGRTKPFDYFYLHGYAGGVKAERGAKNLHLAVRPKVGSVAIAKSVYGPTFTIEGAEEIVIQDKIAGMAPEHEEYARCKNFRFGQQMYPVEAEVLARPRRRLAVSSGREF